AAALPIIDNDETIHRIIEEAIDWLSERTKQGTEFAAAPIGLYFARLWYAERLYPVVFALSALTAVRRDGYNTPFN
ncbi:MAG: hypothetical protein ACYSUT_12385, partial [Planctomycetota bacterium]